MAEKPWVMRFAKAVYPEMTELALSVATEQSMLTDATDLIYELRRRLALAQEEIDAKRHELVTAWAMHERAQNEAMAARKILRPSGSPWTVHAPLIGDGEAYSAARAAAEEEKP